MKHEGDFKERHHRGRTERESRHPGAKTFRRGRAIAFLEMMNLKRATLKQQLETPELQSINPILVGELKSIDMIISEFVQLFELQNERETMEEDNKEDNKSQEDKTKYSVSYMTGPALESLDKLAASNQRFDFFFIDADKENYGKDRAAPGLASS